MVDGDGTEEDATFSPVAGCTLGGWEFFCFWGPRPQERNRVRGWLTDCCSVNQLFLNFSRGTQGGIGAAKCAGAERSTWGNSLFSAGPPKPFPGADSGDCGGFLSMVQGAWSKGRRKECSHERFLRMVQGAWSKGHGPIGPYGPIVIGLLVLLLLGFSWSKGAWSKGAWSKYYLGGNCANLVICK